MTSIFLLLLAAAPPVALVTNYQSLGAEPALVAELTTRLSAASVEQGLSVVEAAEATKLQRSAVMCGEDVACLATLGTRGKARWVLAFGFARVGTSWLFSALLIDVEQGKRMAMFSRSVPLKQLDVVGLVQAASTELFRDVALVPTPTPALPAPVVLPPAPTPAAKVEPWVQAPPPKSHRLRPVALTTTGLTVALVIATVAMGVTAQGHYQGLAATPIDLRPAADSQQRTLNLSVDVLMGLSIAMGITTTTLWVVDARAP